MKKLALAVCSVALAILAWRFPFGPGECSGTTGLLVETSRRALTVCTDGKPEAWYSARTGWKGVGKEREGDQKTPLGEYALSTPQPSSAYRVFIPVGYPTADQRARGLTGSAIGVHGPGRRARYLGPLSNVLNTTDGCVGVWSDADALAIGEWVKRHPTARIEIR